MKEENITAGEIELFVAIILIIVAMIYGVGDVSEWRLYSN